MIKQGKGLLMGWTLAMMASCSESPVADNTGSADSGREIHFEVSVGDKTRATSDNPMQRFSIYANLSGKRTFKAKDLVHLLQADNSWDAPDGMITWPDDDAPLNIFALSPGFELATDVNMKWNTHTFNYTLPNGNYPDFLYGSMIRTQESQNPNSVVHLTLLAAFTYMKFTCQQNSTTMPLDEYTVNVKGITLHNISSKGQFEFLETASNEAEWTASEEAGDFTSYEQEFENPVTLTSGRKQINDSLIVIIPQSISKWTTTADNPVTTAYADANHQCYVELKCQVIDSEGNYLWGSEDGTGTYPEYESVYIPFPSNKTYNINDRPSLNIKFDGGFDRDGVPTVFHTEKKTHLDITVEDWIVEEGTEQGQGFEVEF